MKKITVFKHVLTILKITGVVVLFGLVVLQLYWSLDALLFLE